MSERAAELTPRSSSERKSGPSSRPSCGVARPRRTRGEDGVGETQRETLVLGRRGPRARPAPAAPTARPGLSAAENTHHHGCSEARASAGAHRTAGPEGAGSSGRGGAGGGRRRRGLGAACPAPPWRGGPGAVSCRKKEGRALRPRLKHPSRKGPKGPDPHGCEQSRLDGSDPEGAKCHLGSCPVSFP